MDNYTESFRDAVRVTRGERSARERSSRLAQDHYRFDGPVPLPTLSDAEQLLSRVRDLRKLAQRAWADVERCTLNAVWYEREIERLVGGLSE